MYISLNYVKNLEKGFFGNRATSDTNLCSHSSNTDALHASFAGYKERQGYIMLNNDRIRLMTKLALYEGKEGKEDIRLSKYYKSDYVRYEMIKTIICATIGYAIILALILFYKSEEIIKNAVTLDYKTIGTNILGYYVIVIAIYGFGSGIFYSYKYDRSRKKLGRYYKLLKRLNKLYKEETPEA